MSMTAPARKTASENTLSARACAATPRSAAPWAG